MPTSYRIDLERRTIFTPPPASSGTTNCYGHQAERKNDPRFDASLNQLYDLQGITRLEVTAQGI